MESTRYSTHCLYNRKYGTVDKKYLSSFEDDFENIIMKEINRSKILYALHEYLPFIDEYNKQR